MESTQMSCGLKWGDGLGVLGSGGGEVAKERLQNSTECKEIGTRGKEL